MRSPVVSVADGVLAEGEQLPEFPQGEVALHVLLLVHHAAAQGLLVGLPLQDLLLDRPRLQRDREGEREGERGGRKRGKQVYPRTLTLTNSELSSSKRFNSVNQSSGPHREQSVDVAGLFLPVPPDPSHRLLVVGRVPVRVEHHQAIGANQIQATPTGLAAQHEYEFRTLDKEIGLRLSGGARFEMDFGIIGVSGVFNTYRRAVESLNYLGPFFDGHSAIEPDIEVSGEKPTRHRFNTMAHLTLQLPLIRNVLFRFFHPLTHLRDRHSFSKRSSV